MLHAPLASATSPSGLSGLVDSLGGDEWSVSDQSLIFSLGPTFTDSDPVAHRLAGGQVMVCTSRTAGDRSFA